jgi:flagellin-specific chaperone FliS
MNPSRAYQRHQEAGWSRIDMLLALYDGALERTDRALALLRQQDAAGARPLLARAQLIVTQIAAGIDLGAGETAVNHFRVLELCVFSLNRGALADVEAARGCLATLRQGFEAIREKARQLELSGAIPPVNGKGFFYAVG